MPLHSKCVPTSLLTWKSTYKSVLEIDDCKIFEVRFNKWAADFVLTARKQDIQSSYETANLVSKIVFQTVACIAAAPLGDPLPFSAK
jgi:hypothetical protein